MIESVLHAWLKRQAAVTAICGQRIYPTKAPQGTQLPIVTYTRSDNNNPQTMRGPSSLHRTTLSVDAWADTYADAKRLADALRNVLSGWHGNMDSVVVQGVFYQGDSDQPDVEESDDSVIEHVASNYLFCYEV